MALEPLKIMRHLFGINKWQHMTKPKSSRWRRNYYELAEYWFHWNTQTYPKPERFDYHIEDMLQQVPIPMLRLRTPKEMFDNVLEDYNAK